jgi:tetratricopeptide (TPR) repeat protein
MKRLAALFGLALALGLLPAHAQQNSDDEYLAIYNLMQQADVLQSIGQPRSALASYTQALTELQKFQKTFPNWDTQIVSYRLNYLTGKVNELAAKVPALPAAAASPAPTNSVAMLTPPATNAMTSAPAPGADADIAVRTLNAQVQQLQAQNETLQAKLREALSAAPATADAQELAKAQAQVLSLMKEKDLLRASLESEAGNRIAPPALAKSQQALVNSTQKLAEQTSRADKLAKENQALQERLQLLQAGADSVEQLRVENAALKKQVAGRETPATNAAVPTESGDEVKALRAENAALKKQIVGQEMPATNAIVPEESSDEVKALRARLAVDEAQTIPYTSEELALLKASAPGARAGTDDKSINDMPSGSALLVAEAQNYFSAGAYDKAEADYKKILQADPNNALVLANLAAIELQENKLAEAETHITAALKQSPNDPYNLSTYGYLKFRQQKYDEALNILSRAAKLDPENPQIQNYLGVTLSHKGLRGQAETALRKAVQLDPGYGAAHNNLAVIYLGDKPPMIELARWHYQKALDYGQPRNLDLEKMLDDSGATPNPQ